MKKPNLVISIILACFSIFILLFFGASVISHPRVRRAERILRQDYEFLVITAQFLADSPYESIHLWRGEMERGEMIVFDVGRIEFEDNDVVEAFRELANRRYNVIIKEGNTITFQRWANRHEGWGVAFSLDGNEPAYRSIVIVESLSRPSWYFYITR